MNSTSFIIKWNVQQEMKEKKKRNPPQNLNPSHKTYMVSPPPESTLGSLSGGAVAPPQLTRQR